MENTDRKPVISKKDTMRLLLDVMPDTEAEMLLKMFDYDKIYRIFANKFEQRKIIDQANTGIKGYELLIRAINRIPSLVENKDALLREYAITHYNELSRESKREFCIDMMNQKEFQRDLCDTIFDEMEKQIPAMKPILDGLDIKNNFLLLYDSGGYHRYDEK